MKQDYQLIESAGHPIKAWIEGVSIEDAAKKQLQNIATMPFIHKHIAVMPDVHLGIGATIGSVIATKGAVIPAAVGVDLGCGLFAQRTSLVASDLPDNLTRLRSEIERLVPHGRTNNGGEGDRGAWHNAKELPADLQAGLDLIVAKHPKIEKSSKRAKNHAGTLGTGNHFVEVCLDEEQRVWIMLHSGSRGIGNAIGTYFIEKAKEDMQRWFINLPDKDLAYIPDGSPLFKDYVESVEWAQNFALHNRQVMMQASLSALSSFVDKPFTCDCQSINCHHNYISRENHYGENVIVTRKGAVRARKEDMGIIPGSMGAKSFIVQGKGNPESFCSCSHGAGRIMSRTEAKKTFTLEDHAKSTEGVECRKDIEVLDETPKAYKDIEAVMKAQESLVEIKHTLKQILCVKG